jgi:ATP-dependent protease ClpP protease subunit
MKSWYSIRAREAGAELSIYDEIGAYGVSAKDFIAELGALPAATPIELRLNSPGGSVFDAVAIYNALKRHDGTVTVTIDGIAASAASYVAMAGDAVVMPENAFLMIHDPSGLVMGTAADMRAMAEALDKIGASLVRGYAAKSGKPGEEIAALMAAETWFDAAEALAAGFADRLAEPVRIAAQFDIGRFRNAPPDLPRPKTNPRRGRATLQKKRSMTAPRPIPPSLRRPLFPMTRRPPRPTRPRSAPRRWPMRRRSSISAASPANRRRRRASSRPRRASTPSARR